MNKKPTDKCFKKIFIALLTSSVTLGGILSLHLLLLIPIKSPTLWIGGFILLIGFNILYDINSIIGKVITLFVTAGVMTIFFNQMLTWSLRPSLYIALVVVSLVTLLYMTFAN